MIIRVMVVLYSTYQYFEHWRLVHHRSKKRNEHAVDLDWEVCLTSANERLKVMFDMFEGQY